MSQKMLVSKVEQKLIKKIVTRYFLNKKCAFSHHLQQRFGISLLNRFSKEIPKRCCK